MDDQTWLIELESALLDDCNVNELYAICRGKAIPEALRPDVWQLCLDVRHKADQMAAFNEIFDLPFQHELRSQCQLIVEKLDNDEDERVAVASDLESVLTFYCKSRQQPFAEQNGWTALLLPLLSLKLSRSYTYNLFEAIRDAYVPRGMVDGGGAATAAGSKDAFHVFRLLVLYHDPELCSLLDTKRLAADSYAAPWFRSLFAETCRFEVVLAMWDQYFQHADPFLVFFLALIMLINGREKILAMVAEPRERIAEFLGQMPSALEPEDVVDFCALAQYYSLKTPASFKTDYSRALFGRRWEGEDGEEDGEDGASSAGGEECVVSQALCLPVSVYELVENATVDLPHPDAVRFFLVDCRPAEQYNNGHLSTAFHLDSNLMLQEPEAFATAVQGLLRAQRQALQANSCAGGEHLCFMGSGRLDEDQYMHMAVASFLQKGTQFVSLLTGGYNAIHEYFGENMTDCIEDHDAERCLVCRKQEGLPSNFATQPNDPVRLRQPSTNANAKQPQQPTTATAAPTTSRISASSDLFAKWSNVMKAKSAEVKGKLLDYIVNPTANSDKDSGHQNHSSATARSAASASAASSSSAANRSPTNSSGGGLGRMGSVFSIDEDQEDSVVSNLPRRQNDHYPNASISTTSSVDGSLNEQSNAGYVAAAGASEDRRELVKLSTVLGASDVIKAFRCQEVHMNGYMYESWLIVAESHLVVVRDLGRNGEAQIIVRRPLSSIVKITAKKRQRDLITFKYGVTNGDTLVVTDMDRFLIANQAAAATALVSKQIISQLEASEALEAEKEAEAEEGEAEAGADEKEDEADEEEGSGSATATSTKAAAKPVGDAKDSTDA